MLNQNTVPLLSTLLGGLLAIAGGFIGNYYIQNTSEETNKKKELRDIMEKIYDCLLNLDYMRWRIEREIYDKSNINKEEESKNMAKNLRNLELLTNLYVPSLVDFVNDFTHILGDINGIILTYDYTSTNQEDNHEMFREFDEEIENLKSKVLNILKEKGFSYF